MKRAYISGVILLLLIVLCILNYFILSNVSQQITNSLSLIDDRNCVNATEEANKLFEHYQMYLCAVTYHSEIDKIRSDFSLANAYSVIGDSDDLFAQVSQLLSDVKHLKENERFIVQNIF